MRADFLGGIVEGFYGQPWTHAQRLTLFGRMADWGLNTYFYAPKDDLKHRAIWREPYDADELSRLSELVDACRQRRVNFFYGLSPGLDIRFTDPAEVAAIQSRLRQLQEIGVEHFGLLFDDLPGEVRDSDRQVYPSVAQAHSAVTNSIFQWLQQQNSGARLLFCPTPYCDRMVRWRLGGEDYLETVGRTLHPQIDVLWTGPEIISETISVDSIERLSQVIGRPPVIWDNLHANDYDLRRLYCGPYAGRSPELQNHVRGILSNPNNEFSANFVPLRTLALYLGLGDEYVAEQAFQVAIEEWSGHFHTVHGPLSVKDLRLLAECFYLPHSDGPQANRLIQRVADLIAHHQGNWGDGFGDFQEFDRRIQRIFEGLTQLRDRDLFYAFSRRMWELKEELELIRGFLECKERGEVVDRGIYSETHLPGTYRGGLVAALQRHLHIHSSGRICATRMPA